MALAAGACFVGNPISIAQVTPAQPAPTAPAAAEAASTPAYGGDWLSRRYLSGDWGGARTSLATKGVTLNADWTQISQGVVGGGRRIDWDYGGTLDYLFNADLGVLKLVPGGSVDIRGETRYGETVNDDSGALTPVNTRGSVPAASSINEGVPFTITELTYTQSFTETVSVTIGKLRSLDGDPNEFAVGGGRSQFLDSNFIYNAVTSQTSPYSTLGAGIDWSPTPRIAVSCYLYNTTDSSTTTGFSNIDDGWTWSTEVDTQYRLCTLPGGVNVGALYAFDHDFTNISGKLTLSPDGVVLPTVDDAWAVYLGGWQYLYTPDRVPDEIDASDGMADLRGLGVFARLGFADQDTNPIHWSGSIGLGGRGLIPGRDNDTVGLGYYYTQVQDARAFSLLGLRPNGQGIESYYNVALTSAMGLTIDVQWVTGGFEQLDPATVVGVRFDVDF